jgi:hypothetical protein
VPEEENWTAVVAYRGPAMASERAGPVLEWKILCSQSKPELVGRIVQVDRATRGDGVLRRRCWQIVEGIAEWMGRRR